VVDIDALQRQIAALTAERDALRQHNAALLGAVDDARQALSAMASGEVDAVVAGAGTNPILLRAAQDKLRASEQLSRAIFHGALDALLLANDDGVYVDVNPAACELFGLRREDLLGRRLTEFAAPGYDVTAEWGHFVSEGRMRGRFPLVRPDGVRREVEFSATANILPSLHLSVLRDVTEREKADEARNRLAAIVESSEDAILGAGLDGTVLSWNRSATRLFGYTPGEVIGRSLALLAPSTHRQELFEILKHVERGDGVEHFETVRLKKDGTQVEVSLTLSPIRDGSGAIVGISNIVRDLSEQRLAESALRHTEERLREAQKMEAIGRLAGGVAHDFNNLLSVVVGYAELALSTMAPDDAVRDDMAEIALAGRRATELTQQLLAFSRRQVLQTRVVDVNAVLLGLEKMLRRVLGEDVELELVRAPELDLVLTDPGQFEQVMLNLALNARDAMPTGGRLVIETSNVDLDPADAIARFGNVTGPSVMISVSDTGLGMTRATQARVFEPFFTTKEQGKGTGLGLATVYGVVQQSGGQIEVSSEPGHGSTFRVYLPRTTRTVSRETPAPPSLAAPQGSETILLVEDEDQVRTLARSLLRRSGYHVLEAQNGGEALLLCEQFPTRIDLLLTDVVMPRMSGRQLAERVIPMRPEIKVLFMSGYTDDAVLRHGVHEADVAYLQKPITPDRLLRKVRDVLDGVRVSDGA
jgi:two-component system, cell cycle sensor histidine kinase and response regulator CckA